MVPSSTSIACSGLILSGLALCAWSNDGLVGNPELSVPLSPFGIQRSPYGEVLAMAMQGPIDTDFHLALFGITPEAHSHEDESAATLPPSLLGRMQSLIARMDDGHDLRTNPLPPNETLKYHLRRAAEDKLRLAYQLDPSHYANYNALHFFLAEGITTHPELIPTATTLARETIDYCATRGDDPRPALTAAAACTNVLLIMFQDQHSGGTRYTTADMRGYLDELDNWIARYRSLAAKWEADGSWENLSPYRISECAERITFIQVIRDVAMKTILRMENEQKGQKQS